MGKRKTQKKKKSKQHLTISPEEEKRLHSLLQNQKDLDSSNLVESLSSPNLARALVENLPLDHPEGPDLVLTIGDAFDEKHLKKAVKKWLFRRKQTGRSVPELNPRKETPFTITQSVESDPDAFLGPIDGFGSRAVFISIPQIPQGTDVGLGVVNDREGILEFIFGRYSRKRMREVKALFFEQTGLMVETQISHAGAILEKAYGQNETDLAASANGYRQLRPWLLENVDLLEQPAIYDNVSADNIPKDTLTDSQIKKLLTHPLMQSWIIDPDQIAPILEDIRSAKESPILVSEEQKAARISEIKKTALSNIYSDSERPRLKSRLEEMAYVFLKSEEEEYAQFSLAATRSLDEKDSLLGVNSFLMALMDRTLDLYARATAQGDRPATEDKAEEPSSIIIP